MNSNVLQLFDTHGIGDVNIPKYGWNAVFDWVPLVKCKPFIYPRFCQIYGFITLAIRYFFYVYRSKKKEGKKPFIDCLNPVECNPIYGVPMGGIGSGAIGRGFRGEFCRYSLIPGIYEYQEVYSNQFIVTVRKRGVTVYQQVLSIHPAPDEIPSLNVWNWQFPSTKAAYIGLFPRAWFVYDISEQKIKLFCRQVSPVIPHEYRDSCLPLCLFKWTVLNYSKEAVCVSITFVIKNGTGNTEKVPQGLKSSRLKYDTFEGCCIKQKIRDMDCCFGLAVMESDTVSVSSCTTIKLFPKITKENLPGPFDLWTSLLESGDLSKMKNEEISCSNAIAMATCGKVNVKPMSKSDELSFVFIWHMPVVHFRDQKVKYKRRYTRWFDHEDLEKGIVQMILHSFKNMKSWENQIEKWQKPILDNEKFPAWYKSALFNELYFIVDGGTVWLDKKLSVRDLNENDSKMARMKHEIDFGIFGYLEGHEYRMYNTYDVHHYSSWALISLWPKLQESVQYDFADSTQFHDSTMCFYVHSGTFESRSAKNAIPHDAGDPEEEPFVKYNAYNMYNTDQWKDLSPKFVLQVYRDWVLLKNEEYLRYMMPVVMDVMKRCLKWDQDNDGIIENSGYPDQTYDAWIVKGVSAYTGGLWLAALYAICEMSRYLKIDCSLFSECLKKGKKAYEAKLWTGSFFKFDENSSSIMADQLCGHWYLRSCGISDGEVFDQAKVRKALQTIFQNNCSLLAPNLGAANGCFLGGIKDTTSVHAEEYWVGVNYSLAATMILEDHEMEGWTIAEAAYRTVYETYGLQYQTPEAYFNDGHFRSLGYMRPLAIWAIQHALGMSSQNY